MVQLIQTMMHVSNVFPDIRACKHFNQSKTTVNNSTDNLPCIMKDHVGKIHVQSAINEGNVWK